MRLIKSSQGEEKAALVKQVIEGLVLLEEEFKKSSKGKAFFGGDRIGYVDIAFGSMLGWLRATEKMGEVKLLDEAKTPGLVQWAESFCADGAVKGLIPETEKLVEFAKFMAARMQGAPPKS